MIRVVTSCVILGYWTLAAVASTGGVVYVDADAPGDNDGSSWCDAYIHLQDALTEAAAAGGSVSEIRVAEGVYTPDLGAGRTPGDRTASFDLLSGVALRGGFAGCGAVDPDARDVATFETIMSGDLNGDDDPTFEPSSSCCFATSEETCDDEACRELVYAREYTCSRHWHGGCISLANSLCCELCRSTRCENSYHVTTANETESSAVLDGFSIIAGEANGWPDDPSAWPVDLLGGGLYTEYGSLTVRNCVFADNSASSGGGAYVYYASPSIENCTFFRNFPGGMTTLLAEAAITNTTFIENLGSGLIYYGSQRIVGCKFIRNVRGGLSLHYGAPNIVDCIFVGNTDPYHGGGMTFGGTVFPQLINCGFYGNSTPGTGGGIWSRGDGLILLNCVFSGNSSGREGGGVYHASGHALVLNSTFYGNSAGDYGGMSLYSGATVFNSLFLGNTDDDRNTQIGVGYEVPFEGSYNIVSFVGDGRFVDADGPDDILGTGDDNLRPRATSGVINAGEPDPPLFPRYDADGHKRILCGRLDVGAYEFGAGDYDCDRVVDMFDFAAWEGCMTGPDNEPYWEGCEVFDFDADDDVDFRDFAGFQTTLPVP